MINSYISNVELRVNELNRINVLLKDPNKLGASDLLLIEKLIAKSPYFSAAHLFNSSIQKDSKLASLASLYSNGKLSKKFYDITLQTPEQILADEALEEATFNEIQELDIKQFADQKVEIDVLRKNNLQSDIISTLDIEKVERIEETEDEDTKKAIHSIETVTPDEVETSTVSKYDDEQLPYTFLWWLAKTRATHKAIFQPYVSRKTPTTTEQSPFQQQYIEHIFHLQTGMGIDAPDENNTLGGKSGELIEAFLEKDPQIKPPQHNKLDNENKARKSAEDQNDVVSETLANIYIEQMLYRKAIETYEKLVLKFPEKSRYFADLIKSLERKL